MSSLLGVGGLLLAVPTVINLYFVGASVIMPEERVPVWLGFTFGPLAIATLLGGSALLLALLCSVLPMLKQRIARPTKQSTGWVY